jgi:hypothetical protein
VASSSTSGHCMGRRSRRRRGSSGDACRGGSSAAATASGAEERVRVRERGKEEESDSASLMGHSGGGIRVTGQLEAVGGARERGKPRRRETRSSGGLWAAAAATQCLAGMGDRARLPWALAIWPVGRGPLKLGDLY